MPREKLEVAHVFRAHGNKWREQHAGKVSLAQLKVMSAISHCRSEAMGGHVLRCQACEHVQIAYNSCRNRHCAKQAPPSVGLMHGKHNYCPLITIMWCLPYQVR